MDPLSLFRPDQLQTMFNAFLKSALPHLMQVAQQQSPTNTDSMLDLYGDSNLATPQPDPTNKLNQTPTQQTPTQQMSTQQRYLLDQTPTSHKKRKLSTPSRVLSENTYPLVTKNKKKSLVGKENIPPLTDFMAEPQTPVQPQMDLLERILLEEIEKASPVKQSRSHDLNPSHFLDNLISNPLLDHTLEDYNLDFSSLEPIPNMELKEEPDAERTYFDSLVLDTRQEVEMLYAEHLKAVSKDDQSKYLHNAHPPEWELEASHGFSKNQVDRLKNQFEQFFHTVSSRYVYHQIRLYSQTDADQDEQLEFQELEKTMMELFHVYQQEKQEHVMDPDKGLRLLFDFEHLEKIPDILNCDVDALSMIRCKNDDMTLLCRVNELTAQSQNPSGSPNKWSEHEDKLLLIGLKFFGEDYKSIGTFCIPTKTVKQTQDRARYMSGRNKPSNQIKDFILWPFKPLTWLEIEVLRRGIQLYGQKFATISETILYSVPRAILQHYWTLLYNYQQVSIRFPNQGPEPKCMTPKDANLSTDTTQRSSMNPVIAANITKLTKSGLKIDKLQKENNSKTKIEKKRITTLPENKPYQLGRGKMYVRGNFKHQLVESIVHPKKPSINKKIEKLKKSAALPAPQTDPTYPTNLPEPIVNDCFSDFVFPFPQELSPNSLLLSPTSSLFPSNFVPDSPNSFGLQSPNMNKISE